MACCKVRCSLGLVFPPISDMLRPIKKYPNFTCNYYSSKLTAVED